MTLTEKVFTLKVIKPFDSLSDQELIVTANMIQVKHYDEGEVIYSAHSSLYNLGVIASGEVKTSSGTVFENYFGLESIVHDVIMQEDIIAASNVTLLLISQEHLLTLLYESPHLMMGFLKSQKEEENETKI
jgi:signal-transduction protein with cAMP-binding, CBS, and nucleotidyltransferase domain